MTADALLAKARTWTKPTTPARSKLAYASVDPTIDYLASQDWPAVRIRDAIAKEKQLSEDEARRLYYHITRRLARAIPALPAAGDPPRPPTPTRPRLRRLSRRA